MRFFWSPIFTILLNVFVVSMNCCRASAPLAMPITTAGGAPALQIIIKMRGRLFVCSLDLSRMV